MTLSKAQNRLICVFSALLFAALALGSDASEFKAKVAATKSIFEFQILLDAAPGSLRFDTSLKHYFSSTVVRQVELQRRRFADPDVSWEEMRDALIEELDSKIDIETPKSTGTLEDPKKTAEEILSNPIYVDREDRKDRNWLDGVSGRIGDRLMRWLEELFRNSSSQISPNINLGLFTGIRLLFWVLIGGGIAAVLFFVLRNAKFVGRRRRLGGILEDDEPERTADEYLQMAESLAAESKFRDAIRCLYLACLMKYDDANVARFKRHETNWEHLYRIEASPNNPKKDFRTLTQSFDKVWYGNIVNGELDYIQFKDYYIELLAAIRMKVPA